MPDAGSLAELALRFQACDIDCHSNPGLVVLADGRVLRLEDDEMIERQLTPTGMQQVAEALETTGLMDRDGSYHPIINPGKAGLSAFGPESLIFDVQSGDRMIHVAASGPGPFEGDNQRFGDVWTIPPEAYVLAELADKLRQVDGWLPPEAWDGPASAFVPEKYLLIVTTERVQGELPDWTEVDTVRWPYPVPIDAVGDPYVRPDIMDGASRCLVITRQTAEAIARAEAALADPSDRWLDGPLDSRGFRWDRGHGTVDVTTRMVLPYQPPSCLEAGAW